MEKKYYLSQEFLQKSPLLRILLIMKIAVFLILIGALQTFAHETYSQKVKLDLEVKDVTIREVLDQIENSSEFHFLYNNKLVDVDKRVSLTLRKENIKKALEKLFAGTNIQYTVVDRQIVLWDNSLSTGFIQDDQEYTISGVVTDADGEPLPFASVAVKGTTTGTTTDMDGAYSLSLAPGQYTLTVSYTGYASQTRSIDVTGAMQSQNFALNEDLLSLDEVVVTGTPNPKANIESSVAITTLNSRAIDNIAPNSPAELMQVVPGFLVETSGGEVGNNLFARGIPSAGAYEFVSIQEDGLPVFEDGALQFSNVDNYLRVDETIERVEALRGGSGSIFASNAPGGIINFISKTGSEEFEGVAKFTVGSSGLYRTDLNIGGPLGENLFYNIGGFYRYDEGVRNPGYPANNGGQVKANLTYEQGNSFFRLNYKKLDDRNLFLLPIPLRNPSDPEGIEGFDPNYGTYSSVNLSRLRVPQPGGGYFERSLENGVHPIVDAIGGRAFIDLGGGWAINNAARFTTIDLEYNAIFTVGSPASPADFAANIDSYLFGTGVPPVDNPVYSYVDTGQPASPDLVAPVGFWAIDKQMDNFANKLEINYGSSRHYLTFGFYHSNYTSNQQWNWTRLLVEATDNARLLNLTDGDLNPEDRNYSRTMNGALAISWLTRDAQTRGNINSFYLNEEFTASDNLSIDAGVRLEIAKYRGYRGNSNFHSASLGDTTTTADDMITVTGAPYTYWEYGDNLDEDPSDNSIVRPAFSIGANYKLNNEMATYLRVSNSFRSPIEEAYYDNIGAFETIKPVTVTQFELGYKLNSRNLGAFLNLFYMDMANLAFTDIQAGGQSENLFAGATNYGAELETNLKFGIFGTNFTTTLQNPRLKDFTGSEADMNDNQVRRIPSVFFKLRPFVELTNGLYVYGQLDYFGKKYSDNENLFELPSFFALNAGASFTQQQFTISANAFNLTNTIGLTEGDPRVGGQPNEIFNARPILGAYGKVSIAYNF